MNTPHPSRLLRTGSLSWIWVALSAALSAQENDGSTTPHSSAPESPAEEWSATDSDLTDLSLEQLLSLDIEVTSVAKRPQRLHQAPAAVYVLTAEDIRRSGATSIMEALRMVPGMEVARMNGPTYAITARGFNAQFANKLLVLIDGRSVYSPLFSGTLWDIQDVVLEDIDRIEVIRGPGATLWGANAVNGVINITTKSAKETHGELVGVLAGNEERGQGVLRHGGQEGDLHYRIYAKYFNRDALEDSGLDVEDEWSMGYGGLRLDWDAGEDDLVTFETQYLGGNNKLPIEEPQVTPPFSVVREARLDREAYHALGRWTRNLGEESEVVSQAYYDWTDLDETLFGETRHTFDVEFQHRFPLFENDEVIWGGGYRLTRGKFRSSQNIAFNPESESDQLFSAFVQNEWHIVPDYLNIVVGTKVEHNDYTGFEVQPRASISWLPTRRTSVWTSVSRALRTPSRTEDDLEGLAEFIPGVGGAPNVEVRNFGNSRMRSEEVIAYEAGLRVEATETLFLDLATFYNEYDDLQTFELGSAVPVDPTTVIVPQTSQNKGTGRTLGAELSADWAILPEWRVRGHYSYLYMNLDTDFDSNDASLQKTEDSSPAHQFHLRSFYNWSENVEVDVMVYYVHNLSTLVDKYFRADLRLGWRPREGTELSVGVQGLFHDNDYEFRDEFLFKATRVQTGAYLKAVFRF